MVNNANPNANNCDIDGMPVDNMELLSESELREMRKKSPSLIPKHDKNLSEDEVSYLLSLFTRLKFTADSPRLSLVHGAAAINALSGFLDRASMSSTSDLRTICFDFDSWRDVLEIFIRRWDNNKLKPLKQLLVSLFNVMSRNPKEDIKLAKKDYAMRRTLAMINKKIESTSVKPAFQILDYLLAKGLIDASDILGAFAAQDIIHIPQSPNTSLEGPRQHGVAALSDSKWTGLHQQLVSAIFAWVQYPNVAPAAGRLIGKIDKSFYALPNIASDGEIPSWATPLQRLVPKHPECLETITTHVLPELLKIDPNDAPRFLRTLPSRSLGEGDTSNLSEANIILYLVTVNIAAELKPLNTSGKPTELKSTPPDKHIVALGLLKHPSPSVRIRALSVLIRSSMSTATLSRDVLAGLTTSICHFHTEVDPKIRNEFIALAKILIRKIMTVKLSSRNSVDSYKRTLDERSGKEHLEFDPEYLQNNEKISGLGEEIHKQHIVFFRVYMHFLHRELQPTASYQRHITALQILATSLECALSRHPEPWLALQSFDQDVKWPGQRSYTRSLLRPLFDLTMDPFDDVRSVAGSALRFILDGISKPQNASHEIKPTYGLIPIMTIASEEGDVLNLRKSLYRAQLMLQSTSRADHADGVARLYGLIWQSCTDKYSWHVSKSFIVDELFTGLEWDVSITAADLRLAVGTRPLHGHLTSLRYIISQPAFYQTMSTRAPAGSWDKLKSRLLSSCDGVWEAVKATLCLDSPEGQHLNDQDEGDPDIGTKDTLSFAWRALKESSLLLHALLQASFGDQTLTHGLNYDDFRTIGRLAFTQLAELRHRGAFSTVSQTFALCCAQCTQVKDLEINQLPMEWYTNTLSCIQENASALTRRSAGLPAMITGVLAAHAGGDFFNNAVLDLQAIADTPVQEANDVGEVRLPQVHALNCLKDIFADTRLGPSTEPYVADSLDIAACCLDSAAWAIRNSGLMLFNSLIRRLNGGSDNSSSKTQSSPRLFSTAAYEKFPNLPALITRLLGRDDTYGQRTAPPAYGKTPALFTSIAQRVFPALEIVSTIGLPFDHRTYIIGQVQHHMHSPAWSIREKAANTLAYVVRDEDIASEIEQLLQPDWHSQNALHGRLLCVRRLVARLEALLAQEYTTDSKSEMRLLVMFRSDEDATKFSVTKFNTRRDDILVANRCPITAAAYLDILTDILEALVRHKSRFGRYFGLILQRHLFIEWRGTNIDQPLGRPAPMPALTLESIQQFISGAGQETEKTDTTTDFPEASASLQSRVLERCAELIKRACGGGLASKLIHDLASRKFLQSYQDIPYESPQQFDEALRTHSKLIGSAYPGNAEKAALQANMAAWIGMLALAGDAHAEPSTRLAAVQSIEGFLSSLLDSSENATSEALLGVYITLWDALVDDDEEVRDSAAKVVCRLLPRPSSAGGEEARQHMSLSPAAARPEIMNFMRSQCSWSGILCEEAVLRLIGVPSSQRIGSETASLASLSCVRPFTVMLQQARAQDTALFAEEKQNLYIDEVEETRSWANVLSESRRAEIATTSISTLSAWTMEGLVILAKTVADEEDGPLGWTSKPEVYTLGMRVLLAAKVLISREVETNKCRKLLEEILQNGIKRKLHDLWIAEIYEELEAGRDIEGSDQEASTH